jgi:hypothetical protein
MIPKYPSERGETDEVRPRFKHTTYQLDKHHNYSNSTYAIAGHLNVTGSEEGRLLERFGPLRVLLRPSRGVWLRPCHENAWES